jgi:hypothetical protein
MCWDYGDLSQGKPNKYGILFQENLLSAVCFYLIEL